LLIAFGLIEKMSAANSLTHEMHEARENIRQGLKDQAARYLQTVEKKAEYYEWVLKSTQDADGISDPEFVSDLQAHVQTLRLSAHSMKHLITSS
jgi:hypothetical protein